MKILYITTLAFENNNPANMANIALIKGLSSIGCQVDTLSVASDKSASVYDPSIVLDCITNDHRIPLPNTYRLLTQKSAGKQNVFTKAKRTLKRLYMRLEVYDVLRTSVKRLNEISLPELNYDAIISASDPLSSHILAESYMKLFPDRSPTWIQYWQDPMYMDITRKHLFPGILKREEHRLLSKADKVVYVSPLTSDVNQKIYPSCASKMHTIPPAYWEKRIQGESEIGDRPLVGDYGSYASVARDITPLYKAAQRDEFQLEIVGNGDVVLPETSNISVVGRLPLAEVQARESMADILVCICNHRGTQIPSKVYYYASTDKPILVILDGDTLPLRRFLESVNRFVFCENNPEDIANAVKKIIKKQTDTENKPVEEFSATAVASKFVELIEG